MGWLFNVVYVSAPIFRAGAAPIASAAPALAADGHGNADPGVFERVPRLRPRVDSF